MVTFRPATRADVPAILALLADDDISRARTAAARTAAARTAAARTAAARAAAAPPPAALPSPPGLPAPDLPLPDLSGDSSLAGTVSEADDAAVWAAFEAIDADPRNDLVVAEDDSGIVGTLQLTCTPGLSRGGAERMTIEAVRVRSDLRGRGIGREMIRWALDRGRERGCRIAQLTTDRRRTDAQRFYETLGFEASHVGMKISL